MGLLYEELTEKIIGAFFDVHNELGRGFLEKVYENAMMIELASVGLDVESQFPIAVSYKGQQVGEYFADLCCGWKGHCRTESL